MLVIAHAGLWLAQLAYLAPLVLLVGALVYGKWKARGTGRDLPGDAREHE